MSVNWSALSRDIFLVSREIFLVSREIRFVSRGISSVSTILSDFRANSETSSHEIKPLLSSFARAQNFLARAGKLFRAAQNFFARPVKVSRAKSCVSTITFRSVLAVCVLNTILFGIRYCSLSASSLEQMTLCFAEILSSHFNRVSSYQLSFVFAS